MSKTQRKGKSARQSSSLNITRRKSWKNDLIFIAIIVLLAFSIRYVSLNDNGITSDEPIYSLIGVYYVDDLLHLNFGSENWAKNLEHPPLSKYIYGAASYLVNGPAHTEDVFPVAKLASLIMGVLTCVLVYLIGRDFLDRNTGFAAAVILALLPTFIAHTQIAALESPLAFFVTLTVYLYLLAMKNENRNLFIASAVAFGLVMSTKYNGALILPVLGLFYLIYRLSQFKAREGRLDLTTIRANLGTLVPVKSVLIFLGLAVIMFFVFWPYLWSNPIAHLQQSLAHWSAPMSEYFLGVKVTPPLYYYPVYFLVTLPLLLFIPLAIGIVDGIRSRDPFKAALLLWFVVPFAYGFSSFIQDGIRYIFIIYPAVALLCALGLARAAVWISKVAGARLRNMDGSKVLLTLTAVTAIYLLITAWSVYPYYLDYYNGLTGGPKNVQEHRLFKIGWWGEGIKECMNWIGSTAPSNAQVLMLTLPEDPTNTLAFTHDQQYVYPWLADIGGTNKTYAFSREPLLMPLGDGSTMPIVPDYVIINQKMQEDFNVTFVDPGYSLVYEATVQGAPLAQVYQKIGS